MQVLSRRLNQAIVFGPDEDAFVRITVLQIKKSTVRLAIVAPGHIRVFHAEIEDALENRALVASQGDAHSGAAAGQKQHPAGGTSQQNETASHGSMLVYSRKVGEEISFGETRLTVLKITRGPSVRLGITAPQDWLVYPEEDSGAMSRSATAHEATGHNLRRTQSVAVTEILSRASYLKSAEDFEELTSGLLALRAKRLAPVVTGEETRLLLSINEGVSDELTDRVASLIEKRDDGRLTVEENSELQQLADEVERRGVERLEALSKLAALRGVSLRELMRSLGVVTGDHG